MTGFNNNVNAITEKIANGSIKVTREGDKVTFSGSTYEHKDFLKNEFGCRWDRPTKSWVACDLSEGYVNLLDQMMDIEDEDESEPDQEDAILTTINADGAIDYEGAAVLDENADTGETLYGITILTGDTISVIVDADGTEYFNDDWQGRQPQSFAEVADWRWYRGEDIDF